ncbi:hypothetical protein [Paenibacillus sp. SN-8-1]|uniref:hypothetical protein n=1 Tax=Paenibacillus sp. SN-8-1 TaxID=3435409 RepID=UPI003D9A2C2B
MKSYRVQTLIECIVRNYNNRKVVIWGKCDSSDMISKALYEQHGIVTEYFIDSNTNLLNGTTVRSVMEIDRKSNDIYVVIPLRYHKSIIERLTAFGYKEVNDYAYSSHKPISITKDKMDDYSYSDIFGNKIVGDISNCKVIFRGYNSTITIGNSTNIQENVEIYIDDDVNVSIGNNLTIFKNTKWNFLPDSLVTLGDNCIFEQDGELTCGRNAEITIGSNILFGCRYWIVASIQSRIKIGNDCLFSRDVMIRTNDGHSIFDINTKKNINSALKEQYKKSVIISDHVWVGAKCTCLYNTKIHSGSIVGAHSLVKREFPNNCIIAGSPAKIIRRDIAWSKENNRDNMDIVNEKYIHYTLEVN